MPELDVITPTDGPIVVTTTGEWDLESVGRLQDCLELFDDRRPVALDLAGVTFIDSQTLGVIAYTWQRGVVLSIRNPQPLVEKVLGVSGVATMLASQSREGLDEQGLGPAMDTDAWATIMPSA